MIDAKARIADKPKPIVPHIRWMIRRDLPEVLVIEEACYEHFAWTETDFVRNLRHINCIGMVAEHEERLVGFTLYDLHADCLDVLTLAVSPEHQRRGVGSQMVRKLVGKLSPSRRSRIKTIVADTNLGGHLFLKACEFRAVDVSDIWQERWGQDAYRFEYVYH